MAENEPQGGEYEVSPSGAPIYRHGERTIPFQPAAGDSENIERISDHIERHIGPVATVFHEIVSDLVHIDVHVVEPTPQRNCYTVVTSGMSDAPMNVPDELHDMRFAELMIQLPADWPLDRLGALPGRKPPETDAAADALERWYWPIRWLKTLARLPHEYDTWLGAGHTVPNGDPPEPFADDTKLCGIMVVPAVNVPEEFAALEVSPDKVIHFYTLIPLYAEEMDLKLRKGVEALVELFDKHQVDVVIDPRRPSVARRKWLGLF